MARPLELENRSALFFVVAGILAISAVWAVYEEFFARRPWKDYQLAFFELETQRAEEHLERVLATYESEETQQKLETLRTELSAARQRLADPAVRGKTARLRAERIALVEAAGEKKMEIGFEKSRLDAAFSRRSEALHHGEERKAFLEKRNMEAIEARVAELEVAQAEVEEALAAVEVQLEELTGAAARLEEQIEAIEKPVAEARARVEKAGGQSPELTQIWLPELEVVDRCENCHVGVSRSGYSRPEDVVAFANEVDDRDGDILEVVRRFGVDAEVIEAWVKQAKAGEPIDDGVPDVFRSHPDRWNLILKNHPPERFACTTCHEGQGSQTKGIGALLGAKEFDHGRNDHYWIRPMLATGDDENPPYVQATCPDCHGDDMNLEGAETLNRGQALLETTACWGCHPIEGFDWDRKPGPTLTHVQAKTSPGWLLEWIKYPREWREGTAMPNFWPEAVDGDIPELKRKQWLDKREREASAITAYLWKSSQGTAGYLADPPPKGDVARGRELVEQVGCYGCHAVEESDPIVPSRGSPTRARAPKLSKIGEKASYAWLWNWLKDPSSVWKETAMPSMRLTDAEAADIATYLTTLKRSGSTAADYPDPPGFADAATFEKMAEEGKELIGFYGCFGCHDIGGFENAQRIGADISEFGEKMTSLLDFGNAEIDGSVAAVDPHKQTWHNWSELKLRKPRIYRTDRIDTRMPQFDLNREELRALLVFLRSRRGKTYPAHYMATSNPRRKSISDGERLIIRYNCRGCHMIRDEGGYIRSHYEENDNLAPPVLFSVGAKTRPGWLFTFLQHPDRYPVRPWLEVRMPSFNWKGRDATKLVEYFNALDDSDYPYIDVEPPTDAERIAAGKFMYEKLQCTRCHLESEAVPDTVDLAAVSPNLAVAKEKLRPQWVPGWLADPGAQLQGARMPAFWPEGMSPFPDVLGGDAQAQMEAVRDYVLTVGQPPVDVGSGGVKTAQR